MKIAVMSDIHGNNIALEAAIEDAKNNNVDEYIIAGDLITDFPGTNEVINMVKKLTPYVVKGNRENYIISYDKTKNLNKWKTLQNVDFVMFYDNLTKENLNYIKSLPETLSLNFDGLKIKVVHASPYNISQGVHFNDEELIKNIFKDLKEDILILGHTHEQVQFTKKDDKIILQDGVIGMHNNDTNESQYAIIEYKDGKISIYKRIVKYDKDKLKNMIKKSNILKTNRTWINLCYYSLKTGQDLRADFCKEAQKLMKEKYNGKRQEGIDEYFNVIDDDIYIELSKKYEKYFLIK